MKSLLLLIVALSGVFVNSSRATICKPLSQFKIDCNICYCSENGKEYSCTRLKCSVTNPFLVEDDEDGYVLKPKTQPRHAQFSNDEIPISKEDWDDDFFEVKDTSDDNESNDIPEFLPMHDKGHERDDFENFEDVSLGEQDTEMLNEDLPDYFRFKRSNPKV